MIEKTYPIAEKLLIHGHKATGKLFELLKAEAEQLGRAADPDTLSRIAAEKKDTVAELDQFTRQFGQVLATEQLGVGSDGVKSYLVKAKAAGLSVVEAWNLWRQIVAVSRECKAINEQNGASIALLSRHTQRTLQILRGKSPLAATYGPDGSTRSELFSHTLISV